MSIYAKLSFVLIAVSFALFSGVVWAWSAAFSISAWYTIGVMALVAIISSLLFYPIRALLGWAFDEEKTMALALGVNAFSSFVLLVALFGPIGIFVSLLTSLVNGLWTLVAKSLVECFAS